MLDIDNAGRGLVPGPPTKTTRGRKTMRIKYVQNCKSIGGKNAKIGDVMDIPDNVAKEAIGMGRAVLYVEPEKPETAKEKAAREKREREDAEAAERAKGPGA